jgi:hypothetical protein
MSSTLLAVRFSPFSTHVSGRHGEGTALDGAKDSTGGTHFGGLALPDRGVGEMVEREGRKLRMMKRKSKSFAKGCKLARTAEIEGEQSRVQGRAKSYVEPAGKEGRLALIRASAT